ncbi:MAG TPA: hypothetical protein VMJ34_10495 [Bryobacteraceae bacterium]|nr:hypothetical protein [Bryobacteraceae bacterium]
MSHTTVFLAAASIGLACMAQTPAAPDLAAQRAAMKKLSFMVGRWSGEASILRASGEFAALSQTEKAQFKLDGLLLTIEGVGRAKSDGKVVLQALGLISFDDKTGAYSMRAFNDGRWLESEVKLLEEGPGVTWGFTLGAIRTTSVLRLNEKGEWVEHAELTIGTGPPRKLMDLTVRRVSAE